jgi:hypothetical protein
MRIRFAAQPADVIGGREDKWHAIVELGRCFRLAHDPMGR